MKNARKKPASIAAAALVLAVTILFCCLSTAAEETRNGTKGLSETVTATINYYYYDEYAVDHKGTSPYRPFVANMLRYSPAIIEQCPVVPGYKPYSFVEYDDPEGGHGYRYEYTPSVTLNFNKDSYEVNIFYKPSEVSYSINLMKQNLTNDGYTVAKTIYGTGLTGDVPKEFGEGYIFPFDYSDPTLRGKNLHQLFNGFTLMYYLPEVIAADGSTTFECYYDRNYYNVHFDLGSGGFGSSPIYAPYEFTLSNSIVGSPKRPGFLFTGWNPQLEPTVTRDMTYTAVWKEQIVPVSIVYKTADIKQEGRETFYSYWNNVDLLLGENYLTNRTDYSPGQQPRAEDLVVFSRLLNDYTDAKARNFEDADYFDFDLETTLRMNGCLQQSTEDLNGDNKVDENDVYFKVNGDQSTVITLYYSRKTYNLRFAYAREKLNDFSYVYDTTIDTSKQYLLLLEKPDKILTAEYDQYSNGNNECYGLKLRSLSELSANDLTYWHFDPAGNANSYYVWTLKDGEKKYIDIKYEKVNNNNIRTIELVDEEHKKALTYSRFSNNSKEILLYRIINNKKWCVNDAKDKGIVAAPSDSTGSDGSKLMLLNGPEKVLIDIPEGAGIYISNRTFNGDDRYYDDKGSNGVVWGIKVNSVPEVTLPEGGRVTESTYIKEFTDNNGNIYRYRYYCLSLTAEYGEHIENIWPADVLEEVYNTGGSPYRFGSWSSPKGSRYRNIHSEKDHANILGYYPTMSSELMIDYKNNPVPVQYDENGNEYGPIFFAWWGKNIPTDANIGWHGLEIFYEAIDDDEITAAQVLGVDMEVIDGITYIKRDLFLLHCAHNSNTRVDPFVYEGVTIIPSEAYGYAVSQNINGETRHVKRTVMINGEPTTIIVTKFHYNRNRNPFFFESKGVDIFQDNEVPYGQKLQKIKNKFVDSDDPVYPNIIAPGKYEFAGWYTSMQFFTEEFKVDWNNATMIDRAMKVYAYWKPRTFTVTFYNDENEYENHNPIEDGTYVFEYDEFISQDVIDEVVSKLHPEQFVLPDGTSGHYRMVGWYYKDNGIERAFDPETMAVPGDLHLYMKWTSEIPTSFTVNYVDAHTGEKVADSTTGYSFVGITKTFDAKVDDELYPISGNTLKKYYPCVASSSILMKFDHKDNIKNMQYILRGNIPYRVRYVFDEDDGSETPIHEDLNVFDNDKSIVTERFKAIEGYIPKKYYIKLTVTASDEYDDENETDPSKWNPQNVITFHYIKNEANMPFHIKYMLEDETHGTETVNGIKYREASYIDDVGRRNDIETESILSYAGYYPFEYREFVLTESEQTFSLGATPINENDKNISFTLDERYNDELVVGKEVHIYYKKLPYPVKISYTFTHSIIVNENPVPLDGETPEQAKERERQQALDSAKHNISEWYEKLKEIYPEIQGSTDDMVESPSNIRLTVFRIDPDKKFGTKYTSTAPDLTDIGVKIADSEMTKSIIIGDDDPQNIRRNKIDFYYTEIDYIMIYYEVVLPEEDDYRVCEDMNRIEGLLSVNQQHIQVGKLPDVSCTANDNSIYRFVGWFQDEECKYPVHDECVSGNRNNVFLPVHQYASDTYFYAKYDYRRGDLKITAAPDSNDSEDPKKMNVFNDEYYEYIVRGKVNYIPQSVEGYNDYIEIRVIVKAGTTKIIRSLPIGNYSVEQTKWSWRYVPDESLKKVRVIENTSLEDAASVVFYEKLNNKKWLTASEYYTKE